MTMQRWLIAAVVTCIAAAGCSDPSRETAAHEPRPPQAGQPVSPLATARHMAAIEAAAVTGNQRVVQQHLEGMSNDMLRSMRVADPSRPVGHESARAVVARVPGVRSSAWVDGHNLMVLVDGARYRSMAMIDRLCVAMEPLGDTLAVTVNLQDVTATTSAGADTLSRNCQLPMGEQPLMQSRRQMDVLDPELRRAFEAQQAHRG